MWQAAAAAGRGRVPLIVGGDLNLRDPSVPDPAARHAARRDVDHLFVRGLEVGEVRVISPEIVLAPRLPDPSRAVLSDHPALLVSLGEAS